MKRILLVAILGIIFYSNNLTAMNGVKNCFVRFGESIEKVDNVPLLGKLTSFFPFKIIATSFKDYPIPTMAVFTGLLIYILSKNESVRKVFNEYINKDLMRSQQESNRQELDETLFIFDGEDEDAIEKQIVIEDAMLGSSSFDKDCDISSNQLDAQPNLKFI